MRRVLSLRAVLLPLGAAHRCCASGGGKGAGSAAKPSAPDANARADTHSKADPVGAATSAEAEGKSRGANAAEVLRAVRDRDFGAIQSHAAVLVQQNWKEEHTIPGACLFLFLLTWYWASSARRRAARASASAESRTREEAEQTVQLVRGLAEKWSRDVQQADRQLQLILDKNSELAKDIDRMTAALRQCYINPPGKPQTQQSAQ